MWPIIGVVVGGLGGALIGDRFETALVGAFVGFFVGLILRQRRAAPRRPPPSHLLRLGCGDCGARPIGG